VLIVTQGGSHLSQTLRSLSYSRKIPLLFSRLAWRRKPAMVSSSPSFSFSSIFPPPPPFLASSEATLVSSETLSTSSEALSLSRNLNGSSTSTIPSIFTIFNCSQSGFGVFLGIFAFGFFILRSLAFRMSGMHTCLSVGLLAVSAFACHQRSGLPSSKRRCVFNTRLRVDLTRGRVSPTRRHVRPLSRCSTSTHLFCQPSGSLSGSWARTSLSTSSLLMYRIVISSVREAASSGGVTASLWSEISFQQGKPSCLWNFSSKSLLLLVFGHLTLLLLSVTLLCYFPVTSLCWLLLTPIQLGFGLLIHVVYFWFLFGNLHSTVTAHLNLHGFCISLFRCFIGVFVLPIRLRRGKGFLGLHSQMLFFSTFTEEFVAFWTGLICLSCNFLALMF
jgi:hypothetical protein